MNPSASFVGRVVRVLSSESCSAIRFSIGTELRIQRYMYAYVANAVKENRIHLWFDDSTTNNYDHRTDTITFTGPNVEDSVIVHEATHALLDATHVGKSITKGSHETAAFLAETVYMLAGSRTGHSIEPRRIMAPLYRMARELLAFNESHSTGTYPCPDSDISFIRGTLRQFMNTERTDEMNGIPLELPGGLIRKMLLESRRSAGR